jgi:hypothetical protein
MMRDTEELIRRLAEDIEPVRPLRSPWIRTGVWLVLALPYVALIVLLMSPRGDLPSKMSDVRFVIEQVAALATGITAAMAAFATGVPGHSRRLLVLPLLPLALWLGSLGQGCVQDWSRLGPQGLSLRPDWLCLPAIVLVGSVPALVMAVMLRRGAPLTPHVTMALGGLAAAGLGNFGLRLFHPQDASVMVLFWQVGAVFLVAALAGWGGGYWLNWRGIAATARCGAASE